MSLKRELRQILQPLTIASPNPPGMLNRSLLLSTLAFQIHEFAWYFVNGHRTVRRTGGNLSCGKFETRKTPRLESHSDQSLI